MRCNDRHLQAIQRPQFSRRGGRRPRHAAKNLILRQKCPHAHGIINYCGFVLHAQFLHFHRLLQQVREPAVFSDPPRGLVDHQDHTIPDNIIPVLLKDKPRLQGGIDPGKYIRVFGQVQVFQPQGGL